MDSVSVSSSDSSNSEIKEPCTTQMDTPEGPQIKVHKSSASATSSNWLHQHSVSATSCISKVVLPVCNQKNIEDRYNIRVFLEDGDANLYKSVLVTDQDRTPVIIRRAMTKHNLEKEPPEDYQLIQVISQDRVLVVPDNANVFYARHPANFDFVLRTRNSDKPVKLRSRSCLILPRAAKKGTLRRLGKVTL